MDIEPTMLESIDKALTYKIESYRRDVPPQYIKNLRKIKSNLISIPVGRFDLIPPGYEIKDKRVEVPVEFPEFKFPLRDSQQEVYDQLEDNAVINAFVSWGRLLQLLQLQEN